jgi:uncharacterized protein
MYRWLMAGLLAWMIGFVALPATAAKGRKPKKAASTLPKRPKPFTFVTDKAGLLSPDEEKQLDGGLRRYADAYGPQLVVVTVPNLGGRKVADYARALGTAWGVGQRDKNNGLVLLVAAREHAVSIQAGNGLRDAITPYITDKVINQHLGPHFKQGQYFTGLRLGLNELLLAANPASDPRRAPENEFIADPAQPLPAPAVAAADSAKQAAAAAPADKMSEAGVIAISIAVVLAVIGGALVALRMVVRLIKWIFSPLKQPEPAASRAAESPAAAPVAEYAQQAGSGLSYWSGGQRSQSHTYHHYHHYPSSGSSHYSGHSHRSSSSSSSRSDDSAPDYFSEPKKRESDSSASKRSNYDDSSSRDTGGGGFDDRNDNSGTW